MNKVRLIKKVVLENLGVGNVFRMQLYSHDTPKISLMVGSKKYLHKTNCRAIARRLADQLGVEVEVKE